MPNLSAKSIWVRFKRSRKSFRYVGLDIDSRGFESTLTVFIKRWQKGRVTTPFRHLLALLALALLATLHSLFLRMLAFRLKTALNGTRQ